MSARFPTLAAAFVLPLLSAVAAESADHGPSVGVDVTLEASADLHGGGACGRTLHGLALVHAEWAQPEKPAGITFRGYVSALGLAGEGPTEHCVGDFLATSNIEGFASARLYSWWMEGRGRQWSLRAGALLADEEFAGTDAGGNFFNSAFGWPAFISANTVNTGPAFYVAAPGIRFEHTWGATAAWRTGVYDGDSFDSPAGDPHPTRHGLHYHLGGDQGWFVITEAAFTPAGSANRFKAGLWLHTANFADLRDDASGQPFAVTGADPREHGSNHGAYAAIERTLAGEPGKAGNIEAFVRGGYAPADRNTLSWAFDGGIAWTGLLPSRPADTTALGLAHARFSSRYSTSAFLTDPTVPAPDFEQVIEASYKLVWSEHLNFQPDLQYIRHPGGSSALRNAWVFQFRINASY